MASEPFIVIQDLCHSFGTGELRKNVLQDVSIDFYPGEIVIIMGPSGSGKTTLLTLVGALRSVQNGSIRISGIELRNAKPADIADVRKKVGVIFQGHNLIASLTACENVQLGLAVDPSATAASSRQSALQYLGIVGLEGCGHKKPDKLSGGQKQRVAFARALIHQPSIIMADEPTSALDSKTGREVVELLQRLAHQEGVAVLLVTHDNRILDIADRIITLEDGKIEETHLGMERFVERITALTTLFPLYASTVSASAIEGGESADDLRKRFQNLREPLLSRAAEFAARRMSPSLMTQARCLEKLLQTITLCEETLSRLLLLLSAPPSIRIRDIGDSFFQPLEFLLTAMAETGAAPAADGIDMILRLTEDRGGLMTKLRDKFFNSGDNFDEKEKGYLFDMTELFARTVFFIHEWGASMQIWMNNSMTYEGHITSEDKS